MFNSWKIISNRGWASVGIGIYFIIIIMDVISHNYSRFLILHTSRSVHRVSNRYLSVAIDTSFLKKDYYRLSPTDWSHLEKYAQTLAPGYLRIGGNAADELIFGHSSENASILLTNSIWIRLNEFAQTTGLKLLFDLNVLLRNGGEWNSSNCEELLKLTREKNYSVDFQLGNEPNSFPHRFNVTLKPEQLVKDYKKLRNLLDSYDLNKSAIVGPDVTRPKLLDESAEEYLEEFLWQQSPPINAVGWHQYYLNGRNCTSSDFINPDVMDRLKSQTEIVSKIVRKYAPGKKIWLTETGSAYGNGAKNLSNSFAATFLYLDKLGLAARLKLDVVIRQSFIKGNYGMIYDDLTPTPDFWIALAFKQIVGRDVFDIDAPSDHRVRLYAHTTSENATCTDSSIKPKIVLFGINLNNYETMTYSFGNLFTVCGRYIFTGQSLFSTEIQINGRVPIFNFTGPNDIYNYISSSKDIQLPLYSLGFWLLI